MWIMQ
jgi:hypothetical protein